MNCKWTEIHLLKFSSILYICSLQPWRLAPSHMAWWGPTSTQQWNVACSMCLTGSISSTQVQLSAAFWWKLCVLLWTLYCAFVFIFLFLLPGTVFEGGYVDVYTMVKHIDYPRDRETHNITAAIHPQLQVWDSHMLKHTKTELILHTHDEYQPPKCFISFQFDPSIRFWDTN